jgi:hypothetical protein
MKKLALTIICALATASAAFAQGYVNWSIAANSITAQTNSTVYSPLFGGGSTGGGAIGSTANGGTSGLHYMYELLYQSFSGSLATDTHVWDGTWHDTGLGATNSFTASRLVAITAGNQYMQVLQPSNLGWATGTTNSIVLVGWSTTLGSSWADVSNKCVLAAANPNHFFTVAGDPQNSILAFFGESTFGYINPSLQSPGPNVFNTGATPNGLPIYSLNTQLYEVPIPEPATFALIGLGGLSLLLFRRRK